MRQTYLFPPLIALVAAAGCGGGGAGASDDASVTAVATTTQLGDFAREVGGDRVDVRQFLPPNADPHDYEPRPSDALTIGEADVVFQSGGELDEWLGDLIESAEGDADVVKVLDSVETIASEEDDAGEAGADDPHWWQDPRNAVRAVETVRDQLIETDPEGRKAYTDNAAVYIEELEGLDRSVAECIETIPVEQRNLVTTHDALGYYASRYDLEVVGALIPSLSSQAQPSVKDTNELVEQIENLDVKAIFPESSLNPKLEEAVARETGANVGGALYADTLGPEGSSGATYIGSIEANTKSIVEGLSSGSAGCEF